MGVIISHCQEEHHGLHIPTMAAIEKITPVIVIVNTMRWNSKLLLLPAEEESDDTVTAPGGHQEQLLVANSSSSW